MFSSRQIMDLLYVENIEESAKVLVLLMFCFIAISATYIYGTLLTANGSLKTLNKIAIIGLVVNIVLNLIFIPSFKAYGAAATTLITQVLVVIMQIFVVKKKFKPQKNIYYILKLIAVIFITILIGFLIQILEIHWLLKSLAILISAATAVIIFRLIKISDILRFIKQPA